MIAFLHVGFAGMDGCEAMLVEDSDTEDEIQQEAYYLAVEHADRYGYYPRHEYESELDEDEDDEDDSCYVESIEGYAVDYDPELHDMHRAGGGSFEQDFARLMR